MQLRLLVIAILLGAAGYAAPSVVSTIAQSRVRSGLIDAGVSDRNADCMARRMVDRLSILQLRKLEAVQGEKRSLSGFVAGVRKIGDAEVIAVTATSALLCRTGLAKESKRRNS